MSNCENNKLLNCRLNSGDFDVWCLCLLQTYDCSIKHSYMSIYFIHSCTFSFVNLVICQIGNSCKLKSYWERYEITHILSWFFMNFLLYILLLYILWFCYFVIYTLNFIIYIYIYIYIYKISLLRHLSRFMG